MRSVSNSWAFSTAPLSPFIKSIKNEVSSSTLRFLHLVRDLFEFPAPAFPALIDGVPQRVGFLIAEDTSKFEERPLTSETEDYVGEGFILSFVGCKTFVGLL